MDNEDKEYHYFWIAAMALFVLRHAWNYAIQWSNLRGFSSRWFHVDYSLHLQEA